MPLVKIELKKGQSKKFLSSLMNYTLEALIEVLALPDDDRSIRVVEYEADLFSLKPPYEILIEIILFSGRTTKTKANLFERIVDKLNAHLLINIETVFIIINEQPKENWGIRGGKSASDVNIDFEIEI